MGRPRKQPRRIVTFNLNEPIAEGIDRLNLTNRSEWANKVFKDYLEDRESRTQAAIASRIEKAEERAEEEILDELSNNPTRLAAMLLAAMQKQGSDGMKVKGRYTIAEQLTTALQINAFRAWAKKGDDQ